MRAGCSFLSIRAALVLVVLLAITPALLIIIWTGAEYGDKVSADTRAETERQVEAFARIQDLISGTAGQTLSTLAALPAFVQRDTAQMTQILKAVHAKNPGYLNFSAVDERGFVIASSRLPTGHYLGERLHIRRALAGLCPTAGEYIIAAVDADPSFPFACPIRDASGAVSGAITAVFMLDAYGPLFDAFQLPAGALLGIVDRNGTRLFAYPHRAAHPEGFPIKESVWKAIVSGGASGAFVDPGPDGIERYYAFKALYLKGELEPYLYVLYATPTSLAADRGRAILLRNLAIMILVALGGLVSAYFATRPLFGRRLDRIVETTRRIAEGDLAARVQAEQDSSDLGQIGRALDLMAATIQRRDAEGASYARTLAASLEEKEILLREIHHRVKNNLQLVLSLVRLQSESSSDPRVFADAMDNRISSMAIVHEMLYQNGDFGRIELGEYSRRILDLLLQSRDIAVGVDVRADPVLVDMEKAVPFGLLLNELATNAFKHAFRPGAQGKLTVSLRCKDGQIRLEVMDDGPGLPADFDLERSSGLGLSLAAALASQLGGEFSWDSAGGAIFRVDFPGWETGAGI